MSDKPAKPMKKTGASPLEEASPYKSVAEELDTLRHTLRAVCLRYTERVDTELAALRERVLTAGAAAAEHEKTERATEVAAAASPVKAAPARPTPAVRHLRASAMSQVHDLRDMLTVLRTLQLKPAEGRRKDLKKIESTLAELQMLAEHLD